MRRVWCVLLACHTGSGTAPDAGRAGALDPGFGDRGSVVLSGTGTATDVAIGSDGTILVFGASTGSALVIARLGADGAVLATTDTGVATPLGVPDGGASVTAAGGLVLPLFDRLTACDGDGAIGGSAVMAPANEVWHAAIAEPALFVCGTFDAGSPQPLVERVDLATGVDQTARYLGPADQGTIFDCTLDGSGDIAFVGRRSTDAFFGRVDGSAQPALGSDGVVTLRDNTDARAIRASGSGYLVSGIVDGDFGVLRVGGDGTVDFAVTTPIGADPGNAFAIGEQADGAIVAGGTTTSAVDQSATAGAVVRYDATGALDPAFGSGGIVQLGQGTRVFALAVAGAQIVVAGDVADPMNPSERAFYVAKILP